MMSSLIGKVVNYVVELFVGAIKVQRQGREQSFDSIQRVCLQLTIIKMNDQALSDDKKLYSGTMREENGIIEIERAIDKLSRHHIRHIKVGFFNTQETIIMNTNLNTSFVRRNTDSTVSTPLFQPNKYQVNGKTSKAGWRYLQLHGVSTLCQIVILSCIVCMIFHNIV